MTDLRTWSITEAVAHTGIPRATLYALLESGKVAGNRPTERGRWRVLVTSLQSWIDTRPTMPAIAARVAPDQELETRFGIRGADRVFG